jgi:hypothetical protein
MVPNGDCIVKLALFIDAFLGLALRFARFIANDAPATVIELVAASVRRGAANIAIRTAHSLTPVILSYNPLMLGRGISGDR